MKKLNMDNMEEKVWEDPDSKLNKWPSGWQKDIEK